MARRSNVPKSIASGNICEPIGKIDPKTRKTNFVAKLAKIKGNARNTPPLHFLLHRIGEPSGVVGRRNRAAGGRRRNRRRATTAGRFVRNSAGSVGAMFCNSIFFWKTNPCHSPKGNFKWIFGQYCCQSISNSYYIIVFISRQY